ncbi:protein of unknown function [Hymenobacter daecheongensis DSM 21074]|uniref:DUF922 domain-containing protein n=1 Tax=Hymenobacter daecheongensis DSM 21074 TaxID=1121955 RepID=A0A1M6F4P0_9BACT|nr:DUF922 domain-containing protein [Hymenobacter daecheongensis]SHI92622.1 protein of unknown function [Hymenobacter daecheongensis DSM 21074]
MHFFSFLLPLLAWLPAQGPAGQTAPAAAAPADKIAWTANRPLAWADFKGRPLPADQLAALTSATIDVQVGCQDYVFSSQVKAVFIPSESWVRDAKKASPGLLRHEQLHFDITELHARMLRQKLTIVKLDCEHLQPAFKNLSNAAFSAWKREEARYDSETNNGLNEAKQKFWETQVQQRLALLDKFAAVP